MASSEQRWSLPMYRSRVCRIVGLQCPRCMPNRWMHFQTFARYPLRRDSIPQRRAMLHTPQQSVPRHPHVIVYRRAERCKTSTAHGGRLWPSFSPQYTSSDASGGYTIREIVLASILRCTIGSAPRSQGENSKRGAYPFYDTLRPGKHGPYQAEILRRTIRSRAHVLEAPTKLLFQRQVCKLRARP